MESRFTTFNIDMERFIYKPMQLNMIQVFELFDELDRLKTGLETKTKEDIHALFIWDSVSSTPSSKDMAESNPHKVVGFKALELSHNLNRIKMPIAFGKWTFLVIDQVRANFNIDGPFARKDQSVGNFGSYKSATNAIQLHHSLQQWIYMSKGKILKQTDHLGIDGWILKIHMEKNKFAPSGVGLDILFDKKYGVKPIESEYYFMQNISSYEKKIYKPNHFPPLHVCTSGHSRIIQVFDLNDGSVVKESEKFKEKDVFEKYNNDSKFKQIFDEALEQAIDCRIRAGLFRNKLKSNIDIKDKDDDK